MRHGRGGARGWWWSHGAEEEAGMSPGTADQSEPTERNESPEPAGPEPEATGADIPADPFDQVLRHAAEWRAERLHDQED